MAQHDLNIANDAGNAVRADINSALAALGTLQSGNAAPVSPSTGWQHLDLNTPSSSVWNLGIFDGSDWITVGRVDTTNDRYYAAGSPLWGSTAAGTANALTITNNVAPPARFPGQRWSFIAGLSNTGAATLNDNGLGAVAIVRPDGSPLIARDMLAGDMIEAVWDGTSWRLADWPEPLVMLDRAAASSASVIDFALPALFSEYVLEYSAVRPGSDAASLGLRTSVNSGSTYASTLGDYNNTVEVTRPGSGGMLSFSDWNAASILLSSGADIANTAVTINGHVRFFVGDGTRQPTFNAESSQLEDTVAALTKTGITAVRSSVSTINSVRLLMSSGVISSGNFRLYGKR